MSCVCRALLTAVAVSCTLSRTHAHGPSTQRLDRIKDLMCVLLLSGMQKEDLDVKMLNKLERHNVNIHDMNNEELLKECITNNSENSLIQPQTQETKSKENAIKQNGEKIDGPIFLSSNIKPSLSKPNTSLKIERSKNNDMIRYIDGQPELQSVIKFWQDFKMPKSSTRQQSPKKSSNINQSLEETFKYDQKNKINIPDASNYYEANTVQKLLASFLLKTEKINIVQTTERTISINEIKDILDAHNSKPIGFYLYKNRTEVKPKIMTQFTVQEERKNKNGQPEEEKDNINDILNAIKTLKTLSNKKSEEIYVRNNKPILAFRENLYFNRFLNSISNSTTTEKLESSSIYEQKIPQNMIQEIAKSVKELVLRDLRKEMLQITTTSYFTTVTTTKVSTTQESTAGFISDNQISMNTGTNRISTNQISEQSILNKFIDLFEEIKTLKHKTVIISSEIIKEKNKMNKQESSMQQTYPTIPLEIHEMGSPITNHRINQYANFKMQKTFDFPPQIHKFRSKGESKSKKQMAIKSTQPITFQTNNMEIPPLGIPVDKPENPINQNIIVPTLRPYRIGDYKFDLHKIQLPNSRIGPEEFDQKLSNIPMMRSAERFEHNHQNVQYNNEFPNYSRINYEETSNNNQAKNPVIARFHEKLEQNTDNFDVPEKNKYTESMDCCNKKYAFSKQMAECCNHKIASRQQMSLNALKNKSYDDTHFKNFLKSQQKVTDMLERVLAARSRMRSVETN